MRSTNLRRILLEATATLGMICIVPAGPAVRAQTVAPVPSTSDVQVNVVDGKPRFTNRLIDSKSPYLRLHAHNPVDWFPWGEEAFEKARREGKPLFVSIGYSTCHWCHVMEQESFSDPSIAEVMNQHFVSVKVDREERPDIDRVYMSYLQAATGSGGWPMTLFLTPDLKPFFGGTYYAPDDRNGRPGLRTLFRQIQQAWTTQRDELLAVRREIDATAFDPGRQVRRDDEPRPNGARTDLSENPDDLRRDQRRVR